MNAVTDIEDVATEFLERIEPWEFTEVCDLNSSNLTAFSLDHKHNVLYVQFTAGTVYKYYDVSEQEFENLMNAESFGKHFNVALKSSHKYERV